MQYTAAAILLLVLLLLIAVRFLAGRGCARMSETELAKSLALAGRRLAAAGADRERHEAALALSGRLMCEMKRRGMFAEHEFAPHDLLRAALERLAQERFGRSLLTIQQLARAADAAALYQLAVLFEAARERDTARRYLERSAQAGHPEGQFAMALSIFGAQDDLTPQRQQQGVSLLMLAARQGHVQAAKGLQGVSRLVQPSVVPLAAWQINSARALAVKPRAASAPPADRGRADHEDQREHAAELYAFRSSGLT